MAAAPTTRRLRLTLTMVLAAGGLNVFAFAPFGAWPLQILCAAFLFRLVMRASGVREAALLGLMYSFAATSAGVYWLYISLHDIGGMPAWLTVLAIGLLALGLGLLVGAATGGARWLQRRWTCGSVVTLLLILPALWMLAEWTRCWIFTGFPWLSSGYAHVGGPLAGYAALIGVYGVGLIAAVIAALLALVATALLGVARGSTQAGIGTSAAPGPGIRTSKLRRCAGPLLLGVLLLGAGQLLRGVDWTAPHGKPISVRLLQGNVPQAMKFDQAQLSATLGLYDAMITAAPADLIATPETAVPVIRQQLPPEYLQRLTDFASASKSLLLVGIPISDSPAQYSNALVVLPPAAVVPPAFPVPIAAVPATYRYEKHHLVPFGEFIPTGFRWFVDTMQMPLGDLSRGAALQAPFAVREQWVLPNICYEDLFGEEIAAQILWQTAQKLPAPTMMLNISNIAWFGDSIALPQHLQISRMRTLETGRPMLRATNTGATAVIDPHGRIQAQLAPFTRGTLAASVQGYDGLTPFIRIGNYGALLLAGLLVAAAAASASLTARRRGQRR